MSASMTVPEQIDGLERLITLASLRKEDVVATHQELRKQMQLTQAEQEKTYEARAYIAKYDDIIADIAKKQDALEANVREHDKVMADFAAHVESENARLASIEEALTEKENQQKNTDSNQSERESVLAGLKAQQDNAYNEAMAQCQKTQADNLAVAAANAAETERLTAWESELKAKVQKLQEQAANF